MYKKYGDRAAFYIVYIQEAHPSDLWQLPSNVRDKVVFSTPKRFEERADLANVCVRNLGIEIPALLDDIGDSTEKAYTAWPDRLYVIDRGGRLAYKSKLGPFGFKPGDMEEALKRAMGQSITESGGGGQRIGPASAALGEGIYAGRGGER